MKAKPINPRIIAVIHKWFINSPEITLKDAVRKIHLKALRLGGWENITDELLEPSRKTHYVPQDQVKILMETKNYTYSNAYQSVRDRLDRQRKANVDTTSRDYLRVELFKSGLYENYHVLEIYPTEPYEPDESWELWHKNPQNKWVKTYKNKLD